MIDGLVSNCWKVLLENGESLDALIRHAEERSLRTIELRQTCLGGYESETFIPDVERLRALAKEFPGVRLTLALCVPFMSADFNLESELMVSGLRAAEALAEEHRAQLRLVDLTTPPAEGAFGQLEDLVTENLGRLAARLAVFQGVLSLENALHPWGQLISLVSRVRRHLSCTADSLQICFDPCNLLLQEGRQQRGAEQKFPGEMRASDLSMVHIKQSRGGEPLPDVVDGDVDWRVQLKGLRDINYSGPVLLEIAPSLEVWENIERSKEYLASLARQDA